MPQLESEKNIASTENHGEKISGPIANTDNLTDSYNVFKFAAENSNVEWSLQNYTDGTSSVGTANDNSVTITGGYHKSNKGKVVTLDIHSHPNSTTKDLKPSNIDHYRAQRFVEKNKNAKVQLFMPKAPNPNARMLDLVKNKWILNY